MRAGSLRESLVFERKTESVDSFGTAIQTWATAFNGPIPGSFKAAASSEFESAQKRSAETNGTFTIRYRPGVVGQSGTLRILWDSRYWDIKRAEDPDGKLREIQIEAEWIA